MNPSLQAVETLSQARTELSRYCLLGEAYSTGTLGWAAWLVFGVEARLLPCWLVAFGKHISGALNLGNNTPGIWE
jgi:hypothetical protein